MDLTIIIPTKDRFFFLKRILNYYDSIKYIGVLLIIDSSETIIFEKQKKLILNYKKLNCIHVYSKFTPLHAIKEHIKLIKTNFVTYSGDDDYQIINGINECISFLRKNNNFASARGKSYLFELNNFCNQVMNIYDYDSYDYTSTNSLNRFKKFMQHPRAIIPNIWKTKIFKKSFDQLINFKEINLCPDRYFYDEILLTSLLVVNGRVKILKNIQFIMTLNSRRVIDRNKWVKLDYESIDKSLNYTIKKINYVISKNQRNDNKDLNYIEVKNSLENFIFKKYIPALIKEKSFTFRNLLINLLKKIKLYNFIRVILKKQSIIDDNKIKENCQEIIANIESEKIIS